MRRPLIVHLAGERVGLLQAGDSPADYLFAYDARTVNERPGEVFLSVSMPVRPEPYEPTQARPFFEGLLPERGVREQVARNLKLDPDNTFDLFATIGRDCAGAVVILPEGEHPESDATVDWFEARELVRLIDNLPFAPLGVDATSGVRLSLAGAQRKAVLVRGDSGEFGRPAAATPSTHIIKPQYADTRFKNLVYNESLCMRVAECVGLEVARTQLVFIGEHPCLLVERFDRSTDGLTTVRLHQEDCCQALGVPFGLKYESEGGPTFDDITGLLRDISVRGARDVLAFVRAAIVNYVLGNSDAHAKNFALLHGAPGPRLAPFYDIVSSGVYSEIDDSMAMAMALGGEFRPDRIGPDNVRAFAEQCGLSPSAVVAEWRSLAKRTAACAAKVAGLMTAEGLHVPTHDEIVALAEQRAQRV